MIKFQDIHLSFGEVEVLKEFSLHIKKGEKILLDAPSGRGKSSLIKMIMGFIRPQKGRILYKEEELSKHTIDRIRREVTWVNQDINLRKINIRELFEEIREFSSNSSVDLSSDLNDLLIAFGLSPDYLDKNVENLSGGERQRLGLVIAILLNREVLLLDEVTSSLDINLKRRVEEWITATDKTVILVSHDTHWNKENFRVVRW